MTYIADKLLHRIQHKRRGWVFTPKDFLDVGARSAVDKVLSRLAKKGIIRRLSRGIYDTPKRHRSLGILSPNPDDLARALSTDHKIFPSGAMAANILGLSTQVPAKTYYLTNSTTRTRKVAGHIIKLKKSRIAWLASLSDHANLVLQALHYLGKDNVDDMMILKCTRILKEDDITDLHRVMKFIPGWLADTIRKIGNIQHG